MNVKGETDSWNDFRVSAGHTIWGTEIICLYSKAEGGVAAAYTQLLPYWNTTITNDMRGAKKISG